MTGRAWSVALASTAETRGGVWRHLEDLAVALTRRGIHVVIALPGNATELQRAADQAGLTWQPLAEAVRRGGFDVWHAHLHDTYDRRAMATLLARRMKGATVITEHLPRSIASDPSLEPQHPRTRGAWAAKLAFKRLQYALVDKVIAVSSSSARFIEQRYHLAAGRVSVVRNGIPPSPRPIHPSPVAPLRVVALGSLGRQKGFDVLIEAARLARGDWTAVVYGSGPQLPSLAGQVAASGQAARVRFAGWVERPDEHIREAQVVCMPSRWESFPYVALEAAAAGRPVVGSRVDGLDEIILSEETGLLVASECPAELATALDRLAASPDLIPLWGVAAHRRVSNHYRLDQMVDGVLEIYADAIRPA